MIAKLLPVLLALLGLGGGVGAGMALRPAPANVDMSDACGDMGGHQMASDTKKVDHGEEDDGADHDFVKLNNQFVVPLIKEGRVGSLVVLSLNLEISAGQSEMVYRVEPKLRDVFLQALFDHANIGGFDGSFTTGKRMDALRLALRESAQKLLGETLHDVLIVDMVRQDA